VWKYRHNFPKNFGTSSTVATTTGSEAQMAMTRMAFFSKASKRAQSGLYTMPKSSPSPDAATGSPPAPLNVKPANQSPKTEHCSRYRKTSEG
jgi:hypothetical protein